MEKKEVMMKTGKALILLISLVGTPAMQTAEMASRLNEADLPWENINLCLKILITNHHKYQQKQHVYRPHDGGWSQLLGLEVVADDSDHRQENLRSRGACAKMNEYI